MFFYSIMMEGSLGHIWSHKTTIKIHCDENRKIEQTKPQITNFTIRRGIGGEYESSEEQVAELSQKQNQKQ